MKLAEKLKTISIERQTKEAIVTNEIVNFFVDKFENGEMIESFEKSIQDRDVCLRKKNIYLDFWTYIPGCSETYFGLLGKEWNPEDGCGYEHKGVNLKDIYKDVLLELAELARKNFEEEGFKVRIFRDDKNKRYETYIIEVSW